MKFKTTNLEDTEFLAKAFASLIDENGLFVTLTGDIGAGKTQFIRYVLNFLDIKEKITSPSFVILNEYKSSICPIYHFDLYRLEHKGLKSIVEELRQYSKQNVLTFIEWAEFAHDEIPANALKIDVSYDNEDINIRWFDFEDNNNEENQTFIKKLEQKLLER